MQRKPIISGYRQDILFMINQSETPLSAKEIWDELHNKPDFSTVYRALTFLEKQKKINSINFGDSPYFYYASSKLHRHFVYCTSCQRAKGFQLCNAREMKTPVEKETGYILTGHQFYFTGICQNCQKTPPLKEDL